MGLFICLLVGAMGRKDDGNEFGQSLDGRRKGSEDGKKEKRDEERRRVFRREDHRCVDEEVVGSEFDLSWVSRRQDLHSQEQRPKEKIQ
jgi:hypothetical protein